MKSTVCIIFGFVLAFACSKNDDSLAIVPLNTSVVFFKTIGGSLNESLQSIAKTNDGGYAILGHTHSNDGDIEGKTDTSFDFWLLKFDKDDNLLWQKTYGGTDDDRGKSIVATTDGGFAVLGSSKSTDGDINQNFGNTDFWVAKLSTNGDVTWKHTFGFSGRDNGTKLIQTQDDGFLLIGVLDVSASNGEGNSKPIAQKQHAGGDYWAIKLNAQGQTEWTRFFGGSFTDTPYDVVQTQDNGYLLVGSSDSDDVDISGNKGTYDFWVVKISDDGNKIWERSYGGSQIDEAWGITTTTDGNFVIVGNTRSSDTDITNNKGAADIFIIKIDTNGSILMRNTFGGSNFDAANAITKTQDGGYIIAGNSRSDNGDIVQNKGQNDALIFKINENGDLLWTKTCGGTGIDLALDAVVFDDGSIIAIGESGSADFDITHNNGFTDGLIFKLN